MGYYSDLRVAVSKKDYDRMLKKDSKNSDICKILLDDNYADIYEYKENGIECVLITHYGFKYYKDFEEVKQFEKYLKQTKDGYIFLRVGEEFDDIEYKNASKIKELEKHFKNMENIRHSQKEDEEEFEF